MILFTMLMIIGGIGYATGRLQGLHEARQRTERLVRVTRRELGTCDNTWARNYVRAQHRPFDWQRDA